DAGRRQKRILETRRAWIFFSLGNWPKEPRRRCGRGAGRGDGYQLGRFTTRPLTYPLSRASTACGAELAWARAATPACSRICALVRLAASDARSASRMRDSADARLLNCDCARLTA